MHLCSGTGEGRVRGNEARSLDWELYWAALNADQSRIADRLDPRSFPSWSDPLSVAGGTPRLYSWEDVSELYRCISHIRRIVILILY
jgi:hypothetical protein